MLPKSPSDKIGVKKNSVKLILAAENARNTFQARVNDKYGTSSKTFGWGSGRDFTTRAAAEAAAGKYLNKLASERGKKFTDDIKCSK